MLTQTSERTNQHGVHVDRLDGVMAMLTRLSNQQDARLANQEAQLAHQQAQIERMDRDYAEHQRTTSAALERIDRLLDYLICRDQETEN